MVRRRESSHRTVELTVARTLGRMLLAGVTALAVMLAPSCVSLLELDGYASATTELCGVLEQCYGATYLSACQSYVSDRLADAGEAEREAWLIYFADNNCLGSCVNARRCLDEQPLCAAQAAPCGQTEHCCGFSQGLGDCGAAGCCLPDGLECADDGQCCASLCEAATCDESRSCMVCGGTPCKLAGESCGNGFECCSDICDPRTQLCSDVVCLENGVECGDNFECCSAHCAILGNAPMGVCDDPICVFDGNPCTSAAECCHGHCIDIGEGGRVCSSSSCRPDETLCASSAQCCSGYCDPNFDRCAQPEPCGQVGEACVDAEDCCYPVCESFSAGDVDTCACKPEGEICSEQFECCSDNCSDGGTCAGDGICAGYQEPCDPDASPATVKQCCSRNCGADGLCCWAAHCTHSVCKPGVALMPDCLNCGQCRIGTTNTSCPGAVCSESDWAHCCCDWWSADCVAQAILVCGHVCVSELPP